LTLEQAKENLSEDFGFIKGAKILLEAM